MRTLEGYVLLRPCITYTCSFVKKNVPLTLQGKEETKRGNVVLREVDVQIETVFRHVLDFMFRVSTWRVGVSYLL